MAAPLTAMLLLAGAYYATRLAPRVAQRVAMAQSGAGAAQALHTQHLYRRYETGFEAIMTDREALLLLGFSEEAARSPCFSQPSNQEVKEHYYSLIKRLHSDVDGSPYIAMKLNEAKELLLKR